VAEDDLRVAGRDAEVLEQGGGGVSQMVDVDVAEFVGVADAVERADEITRLDRSACLGGEDEAVVLPGAPRPSGPTPSLKPGTPPQAPPLPWRAGQLAKAIHVLQTREITG
jgi:hypothetical protein